MDYVVNQPIPSYVKDIFLKIWEQHDVKQPLILRPDSRMQSKFKVFYRKYWVPGCRNKMTQIQRSWKIDSIADL